MLPFKQKIIGVGLGRTGTASLSVALNRLGIKTTHFINYKLFIKDLVAGEKKYDSNFVFEILEEFQGIANGTYIPYQQIDKKYPGSKFILTIRKHDAWLKSKKKYSLLEEENWEWLDPETKNAKIFIRERVYGTFNFDQNLWSEKYKNHVKGVLNYFKNRSDDLLIMDIPGGDGYEKLCPFLALSLPTESFPKSNSTQEVISWNNDISLIIEQIKSIIPLSEKFILVDGGAFGFSNNRAFPFLEKNGQYWGPPSDSQTAIYELNRLRSKGANYIVFTSITYWWLEHYVGFNQYLRKESRIVFENDRIMIFKL